MSPKKPYFAPHSPPRGGWRKRQVVEQSMAKMKDSRRKASTLECTLGIIEKEKASMWILVRMQKDEPAAKVHWTVSL